MALFDATPFEARRDVVYGQVVIYFLRMGVADHQKNRPLKLYLTGQKKEALPALIE